MATKKVFLLGATGYIGGAVFVAYKRAFPDFEYTVLVRSEANFERLRAAGVDHIIHGTHSDYEKITTAVSLSDIVVNCADADDLPLTRAILDGLKVRAVNAPQAERPILIHTSGTGVVTDKAPGEWSSYAEKEWNDNNEEDIASIDPAQPHRDVDLAIFKEFQDRKINAYIIAPSAIYGTGKGPVNTISQQVPGIIKAFVSRKKGFVIGKGTNVWNNVHIDDLVELYTLVLKHALPDTDRNPIEGRFFFGSVKEHQWGEVEKQITKILHQKKIVASPEPEFLSFDQALKISPLLAYVANNSRTKAERGFALGWRPHAKSLEDTLEDDVDATLESLSKS